MKTLFRLLEQNVEFWRRTAFPDAKLPIDIALDA
jgi:hypothetical protein